MSNKLQSCAKLGTLDWQTIGKFAKQKLLYYYLVYFSVFPSNCIPLPTPPAVRFRECILSLLLCHLLHTMGNLTFSTELWGWNFGGQLKEWSQPDRVQRIKIHPRFFFKSTSIFHYGTNCGGLESSNLSPENENDGRKWGDISIYQDVGDILSRKLTPENGWLEDDTFLLKLFRFRGHVYFLEGI